MADDVIYLNPNGDVAKYTFDFTDVLPDDASLSALGATATSSSISAYSSDGSSIDILSGEAISGMSMSALITPATEGEEYKVEFRARGATTTQRKTKVLEVRSRINIGGSL